MQSSGSSLQRLRRVRCARSASLLEASDLVGLGGDVIVTGGGTPAALAAKGTTDAIPIVFVAVGDPISNGLVANYAHRGGNLTGTTNLSPETGGKRLQLLKDVGNNILDSVTRLLYT